MLRPDPRSPWFAFAATARVAGPLAAVLLLTPRAWAAAAPIDLTTTVVVAPEKASAPERKAVQMLVEEIEKRTLVRLNTATAPPEGRRPLIIVGDSRFVATLGAPWSTALAQLPAPKGAEGYRVLTVPREGATALVVAGNDPRGVLFGVGHVLRTVHLRRGSISLPGPLAVATAPRTPMRGHQLGYRDKPNSYDGWTLGMWEQYFRDLIVFGTNAIELIPPTEKDEDKSPHFPLPPREMLIGMSRLLADYGLEVWLWYPAVRGDLSRPADVQAALAEWEDIYKALPRVDAVFVPGGDPGHTAPRHLFPFLDRQAANLRKHHPRAQMWVSAQGFDQQRADEFYALLRKEPTWLTGVVYAPQTRVNIQRFRELVPSRYPVRHYPDITHSRPPAQYPMPGWDPAYGVTAAREPINPRPLGMASIFKVTQPPTGASSPTPRDATTT